MLRVALILYRLRLEKIKHTASGARTPGLIDLWYQCLSKTRNKYSVTYIIAGVSALNMCQDNCTWVDEIKLDLLPWDAGTDDGVKYVVSCTILQWLHIDIYVPIILDVISRRKKLSWSIFSVNCIWMRENFAVIFCGFLTNEFSFICIHFSSSKFSVIKKC